MDKDQKVICGFAGIGKSTAVSKLDRVFDCDSGQFKSMLKFENKHDIADDPKLFTQEYVSFILSSLENFNIGTILVSTHKHVLEELVVRKILHTLVVPKVNLKKQYISRYKERKSPEQFIDLMESKWEEFHKDIRNHCNNNPELARLYELEDGEYLLDYLKQ